MYILDKYVEITRHSVTASIMPDRVSPHSFRRSKATHLLQAGVNIVYIRDFLGHQDISTTEAYARMDSQMKRKAIENASAIVGTIGTQVWKKDNSYFLGSMLFDFNTNLLKRRSDTANKKVRVTLLEA